MDDYTQQCPECGELNIRYGVFIEDGSIGEWCPNCDKSLQKMEKDRKTPRLHILLCLFARWCKRYIEIGEGSQAT